jgi:hypothetical protein
MASIGQKSKPCSGRRRRNGRTSGVKVDVTRSQLSRVVNNAELQDFLVQIDTDETTRYDTLESASMKPVASYYCKSQAKRFSRLFQCHSG